MIWGRAGNLEKAAALFNRYHQEKLAEYRHSLAHGSQMYLRKGQRVSYRNTRSNQTETITADKNGYVTLYNANTAHLEYLEALAEKLNIPITDPLPH